MSTGALDNSQKRGAAVFPIPPPLYYGAGFAIAMLLRATVAPLAIGLRPATIVVGVILLGSGVGLTLSGVAWAARHRTTIVPHGAASALLTTGVFAVSRNPMYLGFAVAYTGGALVANTWWAIAILPFVLLIVRWVVIQPEEQYLAAEFGAAYAAYRERTRRWI